MRGFLIPLMALGVVYGCMLEDEFADAQEMLDCFVERYRLIGVDVGVITGKEWSVRAYSGERVLGEGTPIGPKDMYIMGSSGKSITATLCARVVAQGYINWNATTKEIFHDTGLFDVHPSYWPSTLEQFVSHGSGAPGLDVVVGEYYDMVDYIFNKTSWEEDYDNRPTRRFLVETILSDPPVVNQGEFLYSIGGFSIAGAMLEVATNKSFEQLLREEVFQPLGMDGCGFGPTTTNASFPPQQPWGHLGESTANHVLPVTPGVKANIASSMVPDGGLHCNLDSWSRYLIAHMSGDEDFLPADQWKYIHTPITQHFYGFGWFFDSSNPVTGTIFQHGGTDGHNFAQAYVIPRFQIALMIGMNNAGTMIGESRQGIGFGKVVEWVFTHAAGKEFAREMMKTIEKSHSNKDYFLSL